MAMDVLQTGEQVIPAGNQILFAPVGSYYRIRGIYHDCSGNAWDETVTKSCSLLVIPDTASWKGGKMFLVFRL
jgi:hypothetical protein